MRSPEEETLMATIRAALANCTDLPMSPEGRERMRRKVFNLSHMVSRPERYETTQAEFEATIRALYAADPERFA